MQNKITILVAVLLLALSTVSAFAAHPLATDDTGTQGVLKFQLETTGEFGWDRETSNGVTTKADYQTLNATLTAGVLESLDAVISYPFTWQHIEESDGNSASNTGLNDLSLALKWRFLELGPVSFGVKPCITLPTANRDKKLGAGRVSYGATLISSVDLKPFAVHANVGYTNQKYTDADKDGSRASLWNMSLAGTAEVLKGLQIVAEVATTSNPDKAVSTWQTCLLGGVIYSPLENLDLSLGFKGSVTRPEIDKALLAGVTFRFP